MFPLPASFSAVSRSRLLTNRSLLRNTTSTNISQHVRSSSHLASLDVAETLLLAAGVFTASGVMGVGAVSVFRWMDSVERALNKLESDGNAEFEFFEAELDSMKKDLETIKAGSVAASLDKRVTLLETAAFAKEPQGKELASPLTSARESDSEAVKKNGDHK